MKTQTLPNIQANPGLKSKKPSVQFLPNTNPKDALISPALKNNLAANKTPNQNSKFFNAFQQQNANQLNRNQSQPINSENQSGGGGINKLLQPSFTKRLSIVPLMARKSTSKMLTIKRVETVTGKNIANIQLAKLIGDANTGSINFEGMPRMIFEEEHRNQKINWIKLVNNILSFTQSEIQSKEQRNRTYQMKNEMKELYQKEQERQLFLNLQKQLSKMPQINEMAMNEAESDEERRDSLDSDFGQKIAIKLQEHDSPRRKLFKKFSNEFVISPSILGYNADKPRTKTEVVKGKITNSQLHTPSVAMEQLLERKYRRKEGTVSMLGTVPTQLDEDDNSNGFESYNFANLNYKNKIRRKSCICSRCYGGHYDPQKCKGLHLVLASDFPYYLQEQRRQEAEVENEVMSSIQRTQTCYRRRSTKKLQASQKALKNLRNSPQSKQSSPTNKSAASSRTLTASDKNQSNPSNANFQNMLQLRLQQADGQSQSNQVDIDDFYLAENRRNSKKSLFNNGKKQIDDNGSVEASPRTCGTDRDSKQSAHKRRTISINQKTSAMLADPLKTVKIPQPLFREQRYMLKQKTPRQSELVQEDTVKLPELTDVKQKLKIKYTDKNDYLKKLLKQSKSTRDMEILNTYQGKNPTQLLIKEGVQHPLVSTKSQTSSMKKLHKRINSHGGDNLIYMTTGGMGYQKTTDRLIKQYQTIGIHNYQPIMVQKVAKTSHTTVRSKKKLVKIRSSTANIQKITEEK